MTDEKKINEEDVLIKLLAKHYGQEFINYLDSLYHENHDDPLELPCKDIDSEGPTEIITPEFQSLYMDIMYNMKDGSFLHFEHYSGILTENKLTHTGRYILEKYEGLYEKINTIIISTGNPDKATRKLYIGERTTFEVFRIIFLKDYDGEEKLKKIKNIISNNKKLTIYQVIELILIPLFRINRPPEEIIEEICHLTEKLVDATENEKELLEWGLTLVSNKFVKDPEKLKEIREVIRVNNETIQSSLHRYVKDEREYARQEAMEEAKQEIKEVKQEARQEKMAIVHNMLTRGYPLEEIVEITHLDLNTVEQLNLGK